MFVFAVQTWQLPHLNPSLPHRLPLNRPVQSPHHFPQPDFQRLLAGLGGALVFHGGAGHADQGVFLFAAEAQADEGIFHFVQVGDQGGLGLQALFLLPFFDLFQGDAELGDGLDDGFGLGQAQVFRAQGLQPGFGGFGDDGQVVPQAADPVRVVLGQLGNEQGHQGVVDDHAFGGLDDARQVAGVFENGAFQGRYRALAAEVQGGVVGAADFHGALEAVAAQGVEDFLGQFPGAEGEEGLAHELEHGAHFAHGGHGGEGHGLGHVGPGGEGVAQFQLADGLADLARQLVGHEGLDQEVVAARVVGRQPGFHVVVAGDEQHVGPFVAVLAQGAAGGDAVEAVHFHVEDDDVGLLFYPAQAGLAVFQLDHGEVLFFQAVGGDQPGQGVVVDDEYFHGSSRRLLIADVNWFSR